MQQYSPINTRDSHGTGFERATRVIEFGCQSNSVTVKSKEREMGDWKHYLEYWSKEQPQPCVWPSLKYFQLTDEQIEIPYTSLIDPNSVRAAERPSRPMDKFELFSKYMWSQLGQFANYINRRDVNEQIARLWLAQPQEVKNAYSEEAERVRILYRLEFEPHEFKSLINFGPPINRLGSCSATVSASSMEASSSSSKSNLVKFLPTAPSIDDDHINRDTSPIEVEPPKEASDQPQPTTKLEGIHVFLKPFRPESND